MVNSTKFIWRSVTVLCDQFWVLYCYIYFINDLFDGAECTHRKYSGDEVRKERLVNQGIVLPSRGIWIIWRIGPAGASTIWRKGDVKAYTWAGTTPLTYTGDWLTERWLSGKGPEDLDGCQVDHESAVHPCIKKKKQHTHTTKKTKWANKTNSNQIEKQTNKQKQQPFWLH